MGLIRAAVGTIGGTLADQWLEAIEPAKSTIRFGYIRRFGKQAKRMQEDPTEKEPKT